MRSWKDFYRSICLALYDLDSILSRYNVLSKNKIAPAKSAEFVRTLNQKKIRWICRQVESGDLSKWQIARTQRITPRHVSRVYGKYKGVKQPKLLPPGRPPKAIKPEDTELVLRMRKEHPFGAVNLEKIIEVEGGRHMPHDVIHKILKEHGIANTEPKKSNRRKWIRYERGGTPTASGTPSVLGTRTGSRWTGSRGLRLSMTQAGLPSRS